MPGLTLTLWPLAGLLAAWRTSDELTGDGLAGYLVGLVVLLAIGGLGWALASRRPL